MVDGASFTPRDSRTQRHSVRTFLNHIAGYADILRQESEDLKVPGLGAHYDAIRQGAMDLREPALLFFKDTRPEEAETEEAKAETQRLLRQIYGFLYDIIGQVQAVKRLLASEGGGHFLPDTGKILDAANGIVEIFESCLEASSPKEEAEAPGRPGTQESRLAGVDLPQASITGRILVVDDNQFNRELLARHLERQGHVVCQAVDGQAALEVLKEAPFDIMIMDVMMPGLNGYQLLERVKSDIHLKLLNVIVISALEDTQSIARCIQLGAEDYLPREYEPIILRARIESCLEKRRFKIKEELFAAAVRDSIRSLRESLAEGADYVRGLLPPRLDRPGLTSDWAFIPSRALGGDVFGYHALGSRRMAIFLLDVSGHGIGAALYSVTLMNILRTRGLPDTDFSDPAAVLSRLNQAFQMEEQNNLYFTAWYGVLDEKKRELRYASAGGPPGIVVLPDASLARLESGGMAVGIDPASEYSSLTTYLPPGSRLFLFSDGAFELRTRDGSVFGLERFLDLLAGASSGGRDLDLYSFVETLRGLAVDQRFEDDVSLLEFVLA